MMKGRKNVSEYMSIRLDKTVKNEFYTFCQNCGMTVSFAVNLLVNKTVEEGKIPFEIATVNEPMGAYEGGEPQMLRASIRIDKEQREKFQQVCNGVGVPMSRLVKMYMLNCIRSQKIPFSF